MRVSSVSRTGAFADVSRRFIFGFTTFFRTGGTDTTHLAFAPYPLLTQLLQPKKSDCLRLSSLVRIVRGCKSQPLLQRGNEARL